MDVLAIGTILITLAFFYILIFKLKCYTTDIRDIVLYIMGVLSATLTQIYSYYFESSAGSAEKSETHADIKMKQ